MKTNNVMLMSMIILLSNADSFCCDQQEPFSSQFELTKTVVRPLLEAGVGAAFYNLTKLALETEFSKDFLEDPRKILSQKEKRIIKNTILNSLTITGMMAILYMTPKHSAVPTADEAVIYAFQGAAAQALWDLSGAAYEWYTKKDTYVSSVMDESEKIKHL